MKKFFEDFENRIKNNWKFCIVGMILFIVLVLINSIFDYASYFSERKYNLTIEGGRTPIIQTDTVVKQNFISEKNNLCRIGIYSLMPGISTNSTVNVKVVDVENNSFILDQNIFLATLKDGEYLEVNIENQFNSRGKLYQIIVTGIDGNELNSIQFPYSTDKNNYLAGAYVGDNLQENNLLLKLTFNDMMSLKKLVVIWGTIFICILFITLYGIDKDDLKEDLIFLVFSLSLGIITCISISILSKLNESILINIFKNKVGIITLLLSSVLGTIYYFILKLFLNKKLKLEKIFLIIAIPIGILYCIVTPLGRVPDEITHATRSLDISYGHFFAKANENNEAEIFYNKSLENIFSSQNKTYRDYIDSIRQQVDEKEISYKFSNMALYSPICHLSQAVRNVCYKNFWSKFNYSIICWKSDEFTCCAIINIFSNKIYSI